MNTIKTIWQKFKKQILILLIGSAVLAAGINGLPDKKISKDDLKDKYDKAPQVIKDKYKIDKVGFRMTAKDNPKDRIEAKIGGDGEEFEPKLKISRWDEVDFSVNLKDTETGDEKISFKDNKIIWEKGNKEVNFYDLTEGEGGYEFEVILKEKPITNIIEFTLETKGVDFFYQPELTQEEIDGGTFRPDNVIGSYAVYASEQKTNWVGGKLYRTGKVGHIYRPKIIDSAGTEVWGDLHIDKGILSVTIPSDFWEKAVYPVRHAAGLTFGYEGTGGSTSGEISYIRGYKATGGAGTATSISMLISANASTPAEAGFALYSGTALVAVTTRSTPTNTSATWVTQTFASPPAISAIEYNITHWNNATSPFDPPYYWTSYYDTVTGASNYSTGTYPTFPDPISWTAENKRYSIYATYTVAESGFTPENPNATINNGTVNINNGTMIIK